MYLEHINSPADVRDLPASELPVLCDEIRSAILSRSASIGGHVASNLGIVELTVALHRVFESPVDKIIFDVSHQAYAHKMLTGRADAFLDPTRYDKATGFANPQESEHDLFSMGHTSTSVSLACGLAKARDLAGQKHDVVAVIGDGALSGGLAFEGLDEAADLGSGIIVVVNDNEWSIARDQGGIYRNLAELRRTGGKAPDNLFRALGFDYRYLENGNDVAACEAALAELRGCDHPVVLHVHTKKGLGFAPAERNAESWHHVGPFDLATGNAKAPDTHEDYAEITGAHLLERMRDDRHIVAVNAATPYIMGFSPERRKEAGDQFVDVGIAEEHAVTYVTALAKAGAKPVLGLYGTFLQRAYDQLWHDLCLNATPATILVFGASARGAVEATHLGYFDIPMLGNMPGLPYFAPTCREEYLAILDWSIDHEGGPVAIRVPGPEVVSRPDFERLEDYGGTCGIPCPAEVVREGSDVAILALGNFFPLGEKVADELAEVGGVHATLVSPRLATTPDESLLARLARTHRLVITLEDGIVEGGFGERCARILAERGGVTVHCYGLAQGYPNCYDPDDLLAACGITVDGITQDVLRELGK